MKKTKLLVIGGLIASTVITASVFASTPASSATPGFRHGHTFNSSAIANFSKNITRTVTNISNGVQITQTTSDSATLTKMNAMFTKIQSMTPKKTNPLITVTNTQISNGIQTTITSTDAATVTKLQANGGKMGFGGGFGGMRGKGKLGNNGGAAFQKNITRTVTNLSNGVQVTETTTDATTLAKLNANFTKEQSETPKKANPLVTKTVTQISNGIQTTITSTDSATVTKLQAGKGSFGRMGGGRKHTPKTTTPVTK